MKQHFLIFAATIVLIPTVLFAQEKSNAELYVSACASCHGIDGRGRAQKDIAFELALPDFSDCEFASREPDPDWYAVIHEGGRVRAFDRMMPAFGEALTSEEIDRILAHIRTFCEEKSWPRGEFNLPRPLFTEKAFPEDETVVTAQHDRGDRQAYELEILYEKRFGPLGMVEVAIPLVTLDPINGDRQAGFGDISMGYKHTIYHSLGSGNILSIGGEVILPTGDENNGMGKGTTIIEPFMTYGKLLPGDAFFQAHVFAEFPTSTKMDNELGYRMALGRTWTSGGEFGRSWSPMLEVLSVRDLTASAKVKMDLVPQVQVALNTRQHILLNVGTKIPITERSGRDTQIVVYLLWDWFDGGFFDGW